MRTAVLLVMLMALLCHTINAQPIPQKQYAFINGHVVDPVKEEIVENTMVLVADGEIERILQGENGAPDGYEVIDLDGKYIMPGFMDAHTHLSSLSAANRALLSGVTTTRSSSVSNFQDVAIKNLAAKGYIAGPDMIPAGVFITPELGSSILADTALASLFDGVTTDEALRKLVNINIDRGAEFIKTRGTERAGLPNTDPRKQVYTYEQLKVVVDEAAKRGVPIQIHAHGDEGSYAAVRAGAASIEHGSYLSERTLKLMAEKGTYMVPTFSTVYDLTQPGGDYDNPILRNRGRHMLPELEATVKKARELGVPIATGADTGYGPNSMTRVSHEITFFVEMGFSPYEAMRAATSEPAKLFGIDDKTGKMAEGYEADLVVLNSNPVENIIATQDVILVMSNGRMGMNRLPFGIEE
ncbi:amidohydrolase family protein [Gracilimonas mengyeensis]|uniref:Imidazolonepropionase n=1 Tax=Gracilimonas mengyeensis TaxID=1302730 RepID=A0A521FAS8_9BACT|nr:amidohydrolase family protein [Gracilimonas mengyeensis]SMO93308.1 Imidazolonepropionase [Gracilimonas mengyeensis]